MSQRTRITVAYGDGIGPEITKAALDVALAAGAQLDIQEISVGEQCYLQGHTSGIKDEDWSIIKHNKAFLKGPITTPQGTGYKSLNVTIRKALSLFANIRPCRSYHPYVETFFPKLDVVIVRENEEDLYAGVEYRQTKNMTQSLKLISHKGSENIIRYAFEYAVKNGRKKVTCMTKDNIMKIADGMFHGIFDEISKEYPQIEVEHYIIDIGAARLATQPQIFDVIVTLNLYGDIISDIVAEVTGSVGLAGSSNVGENYAMFEAIHGSAPRIAGMNKANPSGIINAAIMMLSHIGQGSVAARAENALLYTIESGMHTSDIYQDGLSKEKLGTREFALEVVKNIGKIPSGFASAKYEDFSFDGSIDPDLLNAKRPKWKPVSTEVKELVGVDMFIDFEGYTEDLAAKLNGLAVRNLELKLISSRGFMVYPGKDNSRFTADHWRCRFVNRVKDAPISHTDIVDLLSAADKAGLDSIKTENLYTFNGKRCYSLAQGE